MTALIVLGSIAAAWFLWRVFCYFVQEIYKIGYEAGKEEGEMEALNSINKAFLDMQVKMRQGQVGEVEWKEPEYKIPDSPFTSRLGDSYPGVKP